ncbi:MAG: hypothetical protein CMJ80_16065 [Planctomycetaceae bacterium]|nr:hypothetical protein [Planctomycetaceae bacterium]
MQLAAARLEQAEQQNQRVPGTVPKAEVSDLQDNLKLAVVTAERNLAKAKATNARSANTVGPIDMRILELRVQMARLQLAAEQEAIHQSIDRYRVGMEDRCVI